jgi:hypothetical protein
MIVLAERVEYDVDVDNWCERVASEYRSAVAKFDEWSQVS